LKKLKRLFREAIMEDTYVYVSVKLYLREGQTEDSIHEIVQDVDYSFNHDDIIETEIVDILDMQIPETDMDSSELRFIDPFDITDLV
tara:strand:+ start:31 stop:291 length:261 start_codon:yes stop_codon:yes gene_type:complete